MLDATRLRVLVAVARHGSVTAAAHALNYAQPSISHHIARLESETGAKLMERSGRGVRLTEAGQLLAERAEEILGRLDAAEAELAAHIGLRQGRVRLAAFGSALGVLVPAASARLRSERPTTDLTAIQAEPSDALRLLRAGLVDVALVFRYYVSHDGQPTAPDAGNAPDGRHPADPLISADEGFRARVVLDEPVYLVTGRDAGARPGQAHQSAAGHADTHVPAPALSDHRDDRWISGCDSCQGFLLEQCSQAGFTPKIAASTDDYIACQSLVAAGLGVAMLPELVLRAGRHPGVVARALPGTHRQVLAVTYGEPPDSPANALLIDALISAAAPAQPRSRA
jgi:DNA-binding transcriptional LysR family regulator